MLTNRRRAGFSSGVFVSTTTTISTFLRTSVPRHLHCFLTAWKRQNARIIRLHTLTCYRPATVQWRDTDWFKTCAPDQTQKRPHFIQSVNRPLPSTLHQRTRITQPPFSSQWVGPKAHAYLRTPASGHWANARSSWVGAITTASLRCAARNRWFP
jgi:hypothetical protein